MRPGFQTIIFGPRIDDIETAVKIIAGAGFQGVEFSQRPDMLRRRPVGHTGNPEPIPIDDLMELLTAHGLELLGMAGGDLNERMDYFDRARQYTRPRYLYINSCDDSTAELAASGDFNLALHPHVYMKVSRIEEARAQMGQYDRLLWLPDVAHVFITGDDLQSSLTQFPGRLAGIHIKDWKQAYGRSYHRYPKGFTGLGSGDVPLEKVIESIKTLPSDTWLVYEQDYTKSSVLDAANKTAKWLSDHKIEMTTRKDLLDGIDESQLRRLSNSTFSVQFQTRLSNALFEASASDLRDCYSRIAKVMVRAFECDSATVWSYNPAYSTIGLLSAEPTEDTGEPLNLNEIQNLISRSIARLCVTEDRSPSRHVVVIPVFNRFNCHHVRFAICLLFRERACLQDLSDPSTVDYIMDIGSNIAQAADLSLDDLCNFAAAETTLLLSRHEQGRSFTKGLVHLTRDMVESQGASLFLVNNDRNRLEVSATTGICWSDPTQRYYRKGEGSTGTVWERNEPYIKPAGLGPFSCVKSWECGDEVDLTHNSVVFVPLDIAQNKAIGVMRCRNKNAAHFPGDGLRLARAPGDATLDPTLFNHDDAAVVDAICTAATPHLKILIAEEQRRLSVRRVLHEFAVPVVSINAAGSLINKELKKAGVDLNKWLRYDYLGDILSWNELLKRVLLNVNLMGGESSPIELNCRPTLLMGDVIAPAVRQVDILLRNRNFSKDHVSYDLTSIPPFFIDKNLFQQVVFNLLSNAIKYAFVSPEAFKVEIYGEKSGDSYQLHFRDYGPGIPEDYKETIFEEGVRGPESYNASVSGEGLGLSVVRRVLQIHGGDAKVTRTSAPTEISLFIPKDRLSGPPPRLTARKGSP